MGLLDEIQTEGIRGKRCILGRIIDSMTEADAKDLDDAIKDPSITRGQITTVLRRRKIKVSIKSIYSHTRQECSCDIG